MVHRSTLRPVAFALLSLLVAACSRTPAAPDPLPPGGSKVLPGAADPPAAVTAPLAKAAPEVFPVNGGLFTFTLEDGSLTGTYEGESTTGSGPESARLALHVSGGSGAFAGASGELSGTGRGAFSGEGGFQLTVTGTIRTNSESAIRLKAKGQATLSCGTEGPILNLEGRGPAGRLGETSVRLTHATGGGACAP